MNVLHILASGGTGGIETLCRDFDRYSVHNNTYIFVRGRNGNIYLQMKANGADVIELNVAGKINELKALRKIDEIRKDRKIDVVITHHAYPLAYAYLIWIKKRKLPIKIIVYAHGNAVDMCHVNNKKGLKFRKLITNYAIQNADAIVAISESVKRSLVTFFHVEPEKIIVIYNGVDIARFALKKNKAYNESMTHFIYVGRLIKEKGVQTTLKALAHLPDHYNWLFTIVGDGDYRQTLEDLVFKINIGSKVMFLGTRTDIPRLLQNADVFIHMPEWEEGFGITIVEAMAAGLICICGDTGAVSEIINDGKDGLLVTKGNADELVKRIKGCFMLSPADINKISSAAKERAAKFSIEVFVKKLDMMISRGNSGGDRNIIRHMDAER